MTHPGERYTSSLHITAKADCEYCHGEGWLLPEPRWGRVPVRCLCIKEQIPEGVDDEVLIVIVPAKEDSR